MSEPKVSQTFVTPCFTNISDEPIINSNNTEDILQNLLEKFERFYNNSLDSSLNFPDAKKPYDQN